MEIERANKKVKAMDNSFQTWIKDSYIPDWLIEQLLIRLTPKVVFTLKVVSKKWLSIIVDPTFVKMYCSRALSLQKYQPWTFIARYEDDNHIQQLVDTYSSNFKWPQVYSVSLPCYPWSYESGNFIHGVSNGVVLNGSGFLNYRISNPVTGKWISIPRNCEKGYMENGLISKYCSFMKNVKNGVMTSYTVVRFHGSEGDQSKFITCYVFLSEVGEWKKYTVDISIKFTPFHSSAILNGVVHWELWEPHLVAYDPHKHPDRVRIIALPYRYSTPRYSICAAYQGKLRYFHADSFGHLESFNIWVLHSYSSDEWCLQHRVYYDNIQICSTLSRPDLRHIRLLSFHPYDSDIVYMSHKGTIILYNIKTKKLEMPKDFEQFKDQSNGRETFSNLHTLMIPPWPTSYARPLLELQRK